MNTEERNRLIATKLDEGLSLFEVQKLLSNDYAVTMTYLELRLIAADLEVDWKKQDKETPAEEKDAPVAVAEAEAEPKAKVAISKLVRPGASMSGDVEFASGAKAEWFVDSMGRLGLNPTSGSEKPTEDDLMDFQTELQQKLAGGAY